MPNWCVGIMKVRGTSENLIRFFREGIYYSQDKKAPVIHENEGVLDYVNVKESGYIAIKGVTRNEIQPTDSFGEIHFTDYEDEDGIKVGYFRFETAWGIEPAQLVDVSKNYGIDIRIHAFEQGMEFEQFIEVHAGNLIKDETISFDGRCWAWECVNPNWGRITMNTITLTLLHPPRELSPNASKPLTMRGASIAAKKKASAVKKARDHAHVMTLFALKGAKIQPSAYALTWYYKGRKPDEDNCIAWIKAYMDGACRAMGIDDKDLHLADIQRVHDLERAGFLTITFEEVEG